MGIADWFGGLDVRGNVPLVAIAVLLIVLGVNAVIPNFFGEAASVARVILGVAAGMAGVYVVYHSAMTRNKIDDWLGVIFGMILLGVAAWLGFGQNIIELFSGVTNAVAAAMPHITAGIMALAGIVLVTRRHYLMQFIGLFLLIAALAIFGVNIMGVFRW